ncbi:DgyrCDS4080 [Dimorphilus gyrociliatus]|uniref:DgyrCDS4080 n=1 Tax=Dimorphilus gyrociliatus TaxID=2664684 RepID=A0A7I8VHC8_9ANNE|nr:DgyrCDS4080 [Dimorphilus gyrociliatus]
MTDDTDSSVPQCLEKLEKVKEIKNATMHVEKLRTKLKSELESVVDEEKNISEYKSELELLHQEKMAHVEELRLIHADLNLMEATIKAAEEERLRTIQNARSLLEEFVPLKHTVDSMRKILGLEILPDLQPEVASTLERQGAIPTTSEELITAPPTSLMLSTMANRTVNSIESLATTSRPGFRQQPPPMKSCLSCHQQIHRNAPICPLCKAKSRSRNPKKPRRKNNDD